MNKIYAYLFLIGVSVASIIPFIPIINYLKGKYYYVDTKPIQYRLNKKIKIKKKFKLNKRNKKHLRVNKINRLYSFAKYNKLNKQNI